LREYARVQAAVAPVRSAEEVAATVSVLGIPETELTPRIRDAIMALMAEVEGLRRLLQQTQSELELLEQAANTDPLLPILNRRAFVRELSRQIEYSSRYRTPRASSISTSTDSRTSTTAMATVQETWFSHISWTPWSAMSAKATLLAGWAATNSG
jgi:hypothetical protein